MKLYAHPASTTSRPVMMFCQEQGVDIDLVVVDLFSGEHLKEPFLKINPNGMVPVLDDDGFILTESSTILRYLANKTNSPAYPKDPKARARVSEAMDWFNSNLYRELGYHVVYPQTFPSHARPSEEETQCVIDWGLERARKMLGILDGRWNMLSGGSTYLLGNDITIADYFGAELVACADMTRADWSAYPNVDRWLKTMKARPAWASVHEVIDGFAASLAEKKFTTV